MARSASNVPVPKVVAATLGAAVATIIVVALAALTDTETPAGLEGAVATIAAFVLGYLKAPAGVNEEL